MQYFFLHLKDGKITKFMVGELKNFQFAKCLSLKENVHLG